MFDYHDDLQLAALEQAHQQYLDDLSGVNDVEGDDPGVDDEYYPEDDERR